MGLWGRHHAEAGFHGMMDSEPTDMSTACRESTDSVTDGTELALEPCELACPVKEKACCNTGKLIPSIANPIGLGSTHYASNNFEVM